jgi:hypothetical protein
MPVGVYRISADGEVIAAFAQPPGELANVLSASRQRIGEMNL